MPRSILKRSGRGGRPQVMFGVSDHPVCGIKVGFAEIFLMPQPPLLTRRGLRSLSLVPPYSLVDRENGIRRDTNFGVNVIARSELAEKIERDVVHLMIDDHFVCTRNGRAGD